MRNIFFTITFILCSLQLVAQPETDLQYFQKKYPGENIVDVLCKQTLTIDIKKGKPIVYYEKYYEKILLSDIASAFASEQIYYSIFDSLVDIEAYSLVPQNGKYKKLKVNDFSYSSDMTPSWVFYDDSKVCKFIYPSLTKGSKIVYIIRKEIKNLYYLPTLFFSNGRAVEKSETTITHSNLVEMLSTEIGFPERKISSTVNKEKKETTIQYTAENIPALVSEKNVINYLRFIPHVIFRIASYKTKENAEPVFILPSLEYLNKLYQANIYNINKSDDSEIKPLVDSIIANSTTEFDKVKSIYYWVQHNIRYIAFEDGDNGFVPTDAALTFSKRYADCKGMSNLMRVMLSKAGITSYLTWVGTTALPYKYTEIPTGNIDNHMILCYFDKKGTPYILDATAEFQSIEFAPPHIQGKECLVGIDSNTFKIIDIPYTPAEIIEKSHIKLDSSSLKINTKLLLSGNEKERYAYINAHKTDEEKRKFFMTQLAEEGQANTVIQNLKHTDLYAVDDTLAFLYDYTVFNYVLINKDEMYLKLFFHNLENKPIDIEKRKFPFELKEKQYLAWEQTIDIPKGYIVSYLPENISFTNPLFSVKGTIAQQGNQITITLTYKTDFITLNKAEYGSWNQMNSLVRKFSTQSIVFKQKK